MSNKPAITPDPINAPDPAINYERADPKKQSPQGTLDQANPPQSESPDKLQKNDAPKK